MKKERTFIFDVDDTLYEQIIPFYNACKAVVDEKQILDKEGLYQSFLSRGLEVFAASESGEMSLKDSRKYRITMAMKDWGIPFSEEQSEEFQLQYRENQKKLFMSDTMKEILDFCKAQGVTLGIMSNGPYEHQMKKLSVLGVKPWIPEEYCFISGKVGASKPSPIIFQAASEAMQLKDQEVYMIGDSFENDMKGAMNAGWKTIWINYHRREFKEGERTPDYIVTSEQELKQIIEKIVNQ